MAYGLTNAKGASGNGVIKPVFSAETTMYFSNFTADKDYASLLFIYLKRANYTSASISTAMSKKSATIFEKAGMGFLGIYISNNVTSGATITPPKLSNVSSSDNCYTCVIEISSSVKTDTTELSSYTFSSSYDKLLALRFKKDEENVSATTGIIGDLGTACRIATCIDEITSDTMSSSFVYAKHTSFNINESSFVHATGGAVACDALHNIKSNDVLTLVGSCSMALFKLP